MEWKEYSINEISKVLSSGGDAAKYQHIESPKEGYNIPIYGNSLNNDGLYGFTNVGEIYDDAVCIAARGAGTGHVFFHKGPFVPIVRLISIVPVEKMAHTRFLYYYLSNKNISGDGSAIPQITLPMIKKMKVSLPPLYEQERISSILSSLDDKIAVNRRICENLEAQAQALFKHWFIDFVPFKDGKFVESELGMIPEGWRVGRLGEVININTTYSLKKGVSAPYLDMKNMPTQGSYPIKVEEKEYQGGMKFKNGDALMARITPCLENGKVAYVNFLKDDEIGFGSTEYIVLSTKDASYSELSYFLCRETNFVNYATKNMNGSSGRQRVSGETIGNYKIAIPTRDVVDDLMPIFRNAMREFAVLGAENLRLSALRDSLLPKLMSGEIKI